MAESVEPDRNQHLEHLIIFENAVRETSMRPGYVTREPPETEYFSVDTDKQAFECLLDRLSGVSNNQNDQDAETSFAVLSAGDGPLFVFASNQRETKNLNKTRAFVEDLLKLAAEIHKDALTLNALSNTMLREILWFNLSRLQDYLVQLNVYLGRCISDSKAHLTQNLKPSLQQLKTKAGLSLGVVSKGTKDKFLSDCVKLIKAITAMRDTPVYQAIISNGKNGDASGSRSWNKLYFYLKQLLDFRLARDAIVDATKCSKNTDPKNPLQGIFKNFKVAWIPSNCLISNPVVGASSLSADYIIRNMILTEHEKELYLGIAAEMQECGLDTLIRRKASESPSRRHIHAEMLIHDFCRTQGKMKEGNPYQIEDFWKGYRYIGSSNPKCQLCQYYFLVEGGNVSVKSSRRKLCSNLCVPGMFENQNSAMEGSCSHDILQRITANVEDDVKRALKQCSQRGTRDLKADFSRPLLRRSSTKDSATQTDDMPWIPRIFFRSSNRKQRHNSVVAGVEFSMVREVEADATDDDEDGGVMVPYAYY